MAKIFFSIFCNSDFIFIIFALVKCSYPAQKKRQPMKKLLFLVAAFGMLFTACEYDDSAINDRIDDLENRVTELEETIAALNQDIAGVQTLGGAMQTNVYVSKTVKGETG